MTRSSLKRKTINYSLDRLSMLINMMQVSRLCSFPTALHCQTQPERHWAGYQPTLLQWWDQNRVYLFGHYPIRISATSHLVPTCSLLPVAIGVIHLPTRKSLSMFHCQYGTEQRVWWSTSRAKTLLCLTSTSLSKAARRWISIWYSSIKTVSEYVTSSMLCKDWTIRFQKTLKSSSPLTSVSDKGNKHISPTSRLWQLDGLFGEGNSTKRTSHIRRGWFPCCNEYYFSLRHLTLSLRIMYSSFWVLMNSWHSRQILILKSIHALPHYCLHSSFPMKDFCRRTLFYNRRSCWKTILQNT